MLSTLQIFVLAVVQGLTEFLPISSSAHLNLVHLLTPWPDEGALVDIAIHVGSLFAVMAYFWRDMLVLCGAALDLARGRWSARARLLSLLIAASLPIFLAGYLALSQGWVDQVRSLQIIASANLIFALLLYWADRAPARQREGWSWRDGLLVGLAQVCSLVPGVSRSGVTITMARLLGVERAEAARFSMLLAIPTILAAGAATGYELYQGGNFALQQDALLAAFLSFLTALGAIWAMMAWLKRMNFTLFVAYRLILSAVLFAVLFFA